MPLAHISLGSNLGDREALLGDAVAALSKAEGIIVRAVSSYRETLPVGGPKGQGPFLNAAATLETTLAPADVLRILQSVEQASGRVRTVRWGERPLDLDLLLYDGLELRTPDLTVPHPRMALRRFVLAPLAEITPEAVHPATGRTILSLLENLDRRPSYVAIAGFPRPALRVEGYGKPPLPSDLGRRTLEAWPGQSGLARNALIPGHEPDVPPHPLLSRRLLRDRVCEALPASPLTFDQKIKRLRGEEEIKAVGLRLWALEGDLIVQDEDLVELLRPASGKNQASTNDWLVSDFWYDLGAFDLDDQWKGAEAHTTDHVRYLELRSEILAPTFVVISEEDRRRMTVEDENASTGAEARWPGVRGVDSPFLVVDAYHSEEAFREVMAACEATRAG